MKKKEMRNMAIKKVIANNSRMRKNSEKSFLFFIFSVIIMYSVTIFFAFFWK